MNAAYRWAASSVCSETAIFAMAAIDSGANAQSDLAEEDARRIEAHAADLFAIGIAERALPEERVTGSCARPYRAKRAYLQLRTDAELEETQETHGVDLRRAPGRDVIPVGAEAAEEGVEFLWWRRWRPRELIRVAEVLDALRFGVVADRRVHRIPPPL